MEISKVTAEGSSRVTKTLAAWQRCCAEVLSVWWILRKFSPKFTLFCRKIPFKFCTVFFFYGKNERKQSYSVLLKNFHLVGNFHKKLRLWLISTKKCLYGKFPQKSYLYGKFPQKNSLCKKISTTTGFVGKFPKKVAFMENFRKKLPLLNISTKLCLVGKFP